MFCINSMYCSDHDSMAGYSGRIGFRYKTTISVIMPAKTWNMIKKHNDIGGLCVDVANCLYRSIGFKQTYSPEVDTKARAKNGYTTITMSYYHNSDTDALLTGYDVERGFLKHHVNAAKRNEKYAYNPSQWSLEPNNE